ncbi:unnamed protein product [Anisakis simplex]|uniref:Serpin domain-containing protein n=1 Tax=Anisakis simplex TaxID=6269 RepID=A0A3P6PTL9_ANISI|nr:unnamed protein product [Anisakis simplex]VDK40582.1 unnamed protein product [Anisakis simplex]
MDESLAEFGLRLLRADSDVSSKVISPASAAVALAMVYAGANGKTKSQIEAVLAKGID